MKKSIFCCLLAIALASKLSVAQQPGDLDSTFNSNGINITNVQLGRNDEAYAMTIQTNGMIVVAGYMYDGDYNNIAIARFKTDGTIDNSFNSTGIFTDLIDQGCQANAVAIQTDGKIVAAGYVSNSITSYDFLIIRLNTDGTLDNTFGTNGIVTTDFNGTGDVINDMQIQPDGKIVVTGYATPSGGGPTDIAVARYNTNGTLDTGFDFDGKLNTPFSSGDGFSEAWAMAIQSDGKIIAGGYSDLSTHSIFTLVRYKTNGEIDTTFNHTGIATTDLPYNNQEVYSLAIQSDGKIIAAGYGDNDTDDDFILERYKPNGTLDSTFNLNGIVITDFFVNDERAYSVKIQQDGKIVASGYAYDASVTHYVFASSRYHNDGSLDVSFGGDGKVTTNINIYEDDIYTSAIQNDGKIVVAGNSYNGADRDFAVARYITGTNVGILDFTSSINSFLIYPNPVGTIAHLQYELSTDENISIQLFDVQGKLITQLMDKQYQMQGKHELNIPFNNKIAEGTYLLKISSSAGHVNIKMVKGNF